MNDPRITFNAINDIIRAASRDLPLDKRCALRAGLDIFIGEIEKEILEKFEDIDPYVSEKLFKLQWSVSANLCFDVTNGHDESQHRSWALGALGIVENRMKEMFPESFGH